MKLLSSILKGIFFLITWAVGYSQEINLVGRSKGAVMRFCPDEFNSSGLYSFDAIQDNLRLQDGWASWADAINNVPFDFDVNLAIMELFKDIPLFLLYASIKKNKILVK